MLLGVRAMVICIQSGNASEIPPRPWEDRGGPRYDPKNGAYTSLGKLSTTEEESKQGKKETKKVAERKAEGEYKRTHKIGKIGQAAGYRGI